MPVDTATLAAFIAASILLVMSPGPDTLLILRNTMISGHRTGLATVLGVQLGLLVHTAAAVLGLSVLIASSPPLFGAVALAGAAYLAWLGVQSFRGGVVPVDAGRVNGHAITPWRGCRDAILTNVLNPKVILLFIALMPNFVVVANGNVPLQLTVLAITLIGVNVIWQVAIWAATEQARRWLGDPAIQRAVSWATGLILIVFAIAILIEHLL
ncbi:MAG: LysE family translocator [Alphaproteobacteria bacterium]|nr:LysE family translocator [Alphaproteobacteria bacterium]